jgi:hypothetical protein
VHASDSRRISARAPSGHRQALRDKLGELRPDEGGGGASKMPACRGSRFLGTTAGLAMESRAGSPDFRF